MKKRLLSILLVLSLVLAVTPVAFAAEGDAVAQVGANQYSTLSEAVTAANAVGGGATVTLLENVTLSSKMTITGNVTITGQHTITRDDAYTGTLFAVSAGAKLTLDGGLTIDGGNKYEFNSALYESDLSNWETSVPSAECTKWFAPEEGAPIATAYMITTSGTLGLNDITIQNHYSTNGSGIVSAAKGADVTLDGAQIIHNASTSGSGLVVNASAGVWSREEELITVTMEDGTVIDGNHVGGNHGIFKIYMGTYFTMNGGEIKNTTGWNSNGTVVGIYHAVFTMNGGTICSNSSTYGPNNGRNAAIYGHSNHLFTLNDGTICHNTGRSKAGVDSPYSEVGYTGQTFIKGGTVVDNTILGGWNQPDVSGGATLTITGGTFTQDVTPWCVHGYVAEKNADGQYNLVEGWKIRYNTVAKTGNDLTVSEVYVDAVEKNGIPEKYLYAYETDDGNTMAVIDWYLTKDDNGDLSDPFDFSMNMTDDVVLFGKIEPAYIVSFDPNGGSEVAQQTVKADGTGKAALPPVPSRPGYVFSGWYLNGAPYDFNSVVSGNITLEAAWISVQGITAILGGAAYCPSEGYADVDVNAWYHDAVDYVLDNGLMTGVAENSFAPNGTMTRAMVWTVLGRISGEEFNGTGANWYAQAQNWAIVNGVSDGTDPNGAVTREELVTMLWRFVGEPDADVSSIQWYYDGETVSDWAKEAMAWAVECAIIEGANWNLNPQATALRSQVAAILMRYCG